MFKKIIQKFKNWKKKRDHEKFITGYDHMAGIILRVDNEKYRKLKHILSIIDKFDQYDKGMLAAIKDGEDFDLITEDMIR